MTPIFRISPIEQWREIRSSRRLAVGERTATSAGLSHNVIDAAAGLAIYRGHAYPPEYRGNLFVGCSQNNLVHRRKLTAAGRDLPFGAGRREHGIRPDHRHLVPPGQLHQCAGWHAVCIGHVARSDRIGAHRDRRCSHLDLTNGRDKGRIYRLAPPGFKSPPQPRLGKATTAELVGYLEHPDGWWRDTASRLIYERQDRSIVNLLKQRLSASPSDVGRMHILWALDGLKSLSEHDFMVALADASPGVREHALRLVERHLADSPALLDKVLSMAADPQPRVRFQLAFTLGETNDTRAIAALARIAARDIDDPWLQTAVLSSCSERCDKLITALVNDDTFLVQRKSNPWLEQLAAIVGAGKQSATIARVLNVTAGLPHESSAPFAIVSGLGGGLQRAGGSFDEVRKSASSNATALLDRLVSEAARTANSDKATTDERVQAVRLVGYGGARPGGQRAQRSAARARNRAKQCKWPLWKRWVDLRTPIPQRT